MKAVYSKQRAESEPLSPGRQSSQILDLEGMELRYYAPVGEDLQEPHDRDEVYFVASGSGRFLCEGRSETFERGDAIFVPAYAEHRFEDFTDDLAVWVVFFGPVGGMAAADSSRTPGRQLEDGLDPPAIGPDSWGGDFGGK